MMPKRFVSIWFPQLETDWFLLRRPELQQQPFVLVASDHGRLCITSAHPNAQAQGIEAGMSLADARALVPSLKAGNHQPELAGRLLKSIGEWCIRYTPVAAVNLPDGLILDASGCTHLWGGEQNYLDHLLARITGYQIRVAIADTIGAAWAMARFGKESIVAPSLQAQALIHLPPPALRLEPEVLELMQKLGLYQIGQFMNMPRSALRRRFGQALLLRLDQALGREAEWIEPLQAPEPYQERLPCLEPIATRGGIEIALERLLETLCRRLQQEGKGLREAAFTAYRLDGKKEAISIGTNRASHHAAHLFKLFETRIANMEPGLGIELFVLEAKKLEDASPQQEKIWEEASGLNDAALAELLDRITSKLGTHTVRRYLPDPHHWPERSIKTANALDERSVHAWQLERPRPIQLLPRPEPVEVTVPIPDYPPMLFRYKGQLHQIKKADGPERIEPEWWLESGVYRDYYAVEDEAGRRFWLFRLGHYDPDQPRCWFIHGFFA